MQDGIGALVHRANDVGVMHWPTGQVNGFGSVELTAQRSVR